MNGIPGENIAVRLTTFDIELAEIQFDYQVTQSRTGFQENLKHLGLTIVVNAHEKDLRALGSFGDIVFPVAGNAGNGASLHHDAAILAIAVHHVVNGARVVALEHGDVFNVLSKERLVLYFGNHVLAIL